MDDQARSTVAELRAWLDMHELDFAQVMHGSIRVTLQKALEDIKRLSTEPEQLRRDIERRNKTIDKLRQDNDALRMKVTGFWDCEQE